ncbi:MAG: DUF1049 domain-containing protein [Prochloraceae cyanobacterium]|nr:DUF1049 domain-containing protein [Prochloraceae cyanobacterium]
MKIFTNFLTSVIFATWIGIIAVFSVQNYTQISLKFLIFESIELPVGVILAFSVGIGTIAGAIAPVLWQIPKPKKRTRKRRRPETQEFSTNEPDPLEVDW